MPVRRRDHQPRTRPATARTTPTPTRRTSPASSATPHPAVRARTRPASTPAGSRSRRCATATPFGRPVDPDVKITYAVFVRPQRRKPLRIGDRRIREPDRSSSSSVDHRHHRRRRTRHPPWSTPAPAPRVAGCSRSLAPDDPDRPARTPPPAALHRIHRHHQIHRAPHRHRHQRLRTHALPISHRASRRTRAANSHRSATRHRPRTTTATCVRAMPQHRRVEQRHQRLPCGHRMRRWRSTAPARPRARPRRAARCRPPAPTDPRHRRQHPHQPLDERARP